MRLLFFLSLFLLAAPLLGDDLTIDCGKPAGTIRPLHGVNNGPLMAGGLLDLSQYYRQIAPPLVRLHDSHWPIPDVVDIHVIFPNFTADPDKIESYDFDRTDEYIAAIQATGAGIVYRLGESIEHTKKKYHVHPPKDPDQWARICVGIVRHFNEGWGTKTPRPIQYWEIWNEPENRPNMWTGDDEQYLRLYAAAATAIKKRFPNVKVGGPAFGYVGKLKDGRIEPTPFARAFLDRCRREKLPLDFFSWHTYSNDPTHPAALARGMRKLLDDSGFAQTESHLNEWNYLPDNDWTHMMLEGQGEKRQRGYERMAGPEAAAFIASVLISFQDVPLDVSNFYSGDATPFGLFTEYGVPKKTFHTFKAFKSLLDTPQRLSASGSIPACAGLHPDRNQVQVLTSRCAVGADTLHLKVENLPWAGKSICEVRLLDASHDLSVVSAAPLADNRLDLPLTGPAVLLITLKPAAR